MVDNSKSRHMVSFPLIVSSRKYKVLNRFEPSCTSLPFIIKHEIFKQLLGFVNSRLVVIIGCCTEQNVTQVPGKQWFIVVSLKPVFH